jgi:hypothetical protein
VRMQASCLFAITIFACIGQPISPLHAQMDDPGSEPTEHLPLPKCMAQWYADGHVTKQEWLQACESAAEEDPNYNVDYARCLADWDPETHMTQREWHRSCKEVVVDDPGAFEAAPRER